ncbi:MAG: hypothetical protein AAF928_13385 [Myxococcota bacterium]
MTGPVRIYLAPGMFGFARLAAYDYFEHVERALRRRFRAIGQSVEIRVVEVHPTSSIRRRSAKLTQLIAHTAGTDDGPIHIIGHSTGGLDARLVASPSVHLNAVADQQLKWLSRLHTITTINTPHYGTPLATFFATAKGQQLLYAVCAITVAGLKLGAPPLAAASALVAAVGRTNAASGVDLALIDNVTSGVSRALDEAANRDLRDWLALVRDDQGGVVQLMPEAMDLFGAGVEDRPAVLYRCCASYAPPAGPRHYARSIRTPWAAVSAVLFRLMQRVTSTQDPRYPCAPADVDVAARLRGRLPQVPPDGANDGVVPLSSMLWGAPIWVGQGDHLDMVGHFPGPDGHNDWMRSGASFDLDRWDELMDRIFEGISAPHRA